MVEVLIKETLYDCSGDCKEEGGGLKWGFSWARQDLRQSIQQGPHFMILTITICHDLASSIVVYISGNCMAYIRSLSSVQRAPFLS
jgi:hypothetical protein